MDQGYSHEASYNLQLRLHQTEVSPLRPTSSLSPKLMRMRTVNERMYRMTAQHTAARTVEHDGIGLKLRADEDARQ